MGYYFFHVVMFWSRCRHTLSQVIAEFGFPNLKIVSTMNGSSRMYFVMLLPSGLKNQDSSKDEVWCLGVFRKNLLWKTLVNWMIISVDEGNRRRIHWSCFGPKSKVEKVFSPSQNAMAFGEEISEKNLVFLEKQVRMRKKALNEQISRRYKTNEAFWFKLDLNVIKIIFSFLGDDIGTCGVRRVCRLWRDFCDFKLIPKLVVDRGWVVDHPISKFLKDEDLKEHMCSTLYHLRMQRLEPFEPFYTLLLVWFKKDICYFKTFLDEFKQESALDENSMFLYDYEGCGHHIEFLISSAEKNTNRNAITRLYKSCLKRSEETKYVIGVQVIKEDDGYRTTLKF